MKSALLRPARAAVLVPALAAGACGSPAPPPRHVVLISLDTTRADQLDFYGPGQRITPRLDELAAESIVFDDMMTVVPTTLASHASIFTGRYPHHHGVPRNGFVLHEDNVTLAEILREAGFVTAGFPASFALSSRFGIAQGFDHWDEELPRPAGEGGRFQDERRAEAVTDAVLAWLDGRSPADERLFLFVHYFDAHAPYEAPPPFDTLHDPEGREGLPDWFDTVQACERRQGKPLEVRRMARQYVGELSYMDQQVGRLLDELRRRGILDDALLVVTSDHGENFWDHPHCFDHGWNTYQPTLRAVGVVRLPGAVHAGAHVAGTVATIDLLPTVLGRLGLSPAASSDGEAIDLDHPQSVAGRVRFAQASKPWAEVETDPRWTNLPKNRAVRDGRYKLIQVPYAGSEELYDLERDPQERLDLLAKDPPPAVVARAAELRARLESWAASADPLPSHFEDQRREDTIRRLKALGYLGE